MKFFQQPGLRFDWRIVSITVLSTLLLIVDRYNTITSWKPLDGVLLYLLIPLAFIILVLREHPREYGFQIGDWKAGLVISLGVLVTVLPLIWLVVHADGSMRSYYQAQINPSLPVYTFVDLIGWEFLFRGWLTFAYVRKFGADGLWLQAVPFAIAHITKPELETLSTIFGGFVFGWIAWRTKSFLYPFIIHWAIFTFVVLAAGGLLG
jgi:membrane protease YdiL (CAAX protease family)